ncbi:hypothetical protein F0562_033941 [Nyssa sinensis]|uniref:Uncharacterized protein n=1 Tax=Nyssa sinensis TaxID=561372 RepID=A0A5J5AF88_9ASTE|nr:hypothetical protein F0562_033941 [Nyssa sinensis]
MKAVIEKKRGPNNSKKLPRMVLEALHERITALRWEFALKNQLKGSSSLTTPELLIEQFEGDYSMIEAGGVLNMIIKKS